MMKQRKLKIKNSENFRPRFTNLRPKMNIYSQKWIFHKCDEDPNPSVPHGHSEDGKYKLSLWDGKIYSVQTGKMVGNASKSEMRALYADRAMKQFVAESRAWYENTHPFCPDLFPLRETNMIGRRRNICFNSSKEMSSLQIYLHYKLN